MVVKREKEKKKETKVDLSGREESVGRRTEAINRRHDGDDGGGRTAVKRK